MRVLSIHPDHILFSQYRGVLAFNMADPPKPEEKPEKPEPPKPEDHEGRITDLAGKLKAEKEEKKELAAKLKAFEDAKKAEEDAKLLEQGQFKEALAKKEGELATLTGEHGTAKQQLAAYEKVLGDQLKKNLDAIKDEKKKATVEKLLEGKSLADKVAILPELLETIGVAAPSGFGGPTPAGGTQPAALEVEQQQKRFNEILAKRDMTPKERTEFYKLKNDLQKVWEKKKDAPTV